MKQKNANYTGLAIALSLTIFCIVFSIIAFEKVSFSVCISRLGIPLFRLLGFICIGLIAGQVIEALGWTRQVAVLARPFFKFSNLGNQCSAAFTTAFISGAAANAMLLDFYKEKKISTLQLFLSNYINQFPAFFLHLPTTVFIVIPLTGKAGGWYFLITFLAAVFRTILFLFFGRFYLKEKTSILHHQRHTEPLKKKTIKDIMALIRQKLPRRIINIVIWMLPIYTIVFVLTINGFFDYLNHRLVLGTAFTFMPIESLSVVILSFAAEFASGFAAAGALMNAGLLTTKQTVIALLSGNILAFPVRALRHQLPRYLGIFSPKMGLQLLLSGQLFRVASIIFIGILYFKAA